MAATLTVRSAPAVEDVPPAQWDALTARAPASVAGSRAWLAAALATVDRGVLPHLLAVHDGERVVGLLPLVRDDRAPRPVLRFAAAPFNDLTDLLAVPGAEEAAADALLGALQDLTRDGLEIQLEDVDPNSALVRADRERSVLAWSTGAPAPVIDLRAPDAGPSRRHSGVLDRRLRRLSEGHAVEFRRRDGTEAVAALAEFIRVRAMRLRALRRNLSDPPVTLLEAAVERLAPAGRAAFMEMVVDGRVVARDLYLLDGRVAMLWLRALDMRWLRFSCGHLLLRATIERLAASDFDELDLGRGDEPYKLRFGASSRLLLTARAPAG